MLLLMNTPDDEYSLLNVDLEWKNKKYKKWPNVNIVFYSSKPLLL